MWAREWVVGEGDVQVNALPHSCLGFSVEGAILNSILLHTVCLNYCTVIFYCSFQSFVMGKGGRRARLFFEYVSVCVLAYALSDAHLRDMRFCLLIRAENVCCTHNRFENIYIYICEFVYIWCIYVHNIPTHSILLLLQRRESARPERHTMAIKPCESANRSKETNRMMREKNNNCTHSGKRD